MKEAAIVLKLSERRVRELCQVGRIRAERKGRDWLISVPIERTYGRA